jgi:hypothetical protein
MPKGELSEFVWEEADFAPLPRAEVVRFWTSTSGLPDRLMVARKTPLTRVSEVLRTSVKIESRALSVLGSGSSVFTVAEAIATDPDIRSVTGLRMPALRSATKELPLPGFLFGPW